MRKAVVFIASLIPVIIFGAYALSAVAAQPVRDPRALESALVMVCRRLFENPGDWSASPPELGLALEDESGSVWSFVIDPGKLESLGSLSYQELKDLLGLEEIDVRISFYPLNVTVDNMTSPGVHASFSEDPDLVIGSRVTKGFSVAVSLYVYLAGDSSPPGGSLSEGFYRVVVEAFWG